MMPTSVTMPRLGESVSEGTITRWLKQVGDVVAAGEPLVEVSTDKVDTEIASPASGRLSRIVVSEDHTVDIGVEIAIISSDPLGDVEINDDAPATAAPGAVPPNFSSDTGKRNTYLTRLVRNLAAERNISLQLLSGSGLGGRITKRDVLAAHPSPAIQPLDPTSWTPASAPAPRVTSLVDGPADNRCTATLRMDVTAADELVNLNTEAFAGRERADLTIRTFLVAATVEALRAHPRISGQPRTPPPGRPLDLTVRLSAPSAGGQLVTILSEAQNLSIAGIARHIGSAAAGGGPPAVRNMTRVFNLVDAGVRGAYTQTARLAPGEVASLYFGAAQRCPTVVGQGSSEAIAIRSVIDACLTYDSRAIDHPGASAFLWAVKDCLESPDLAVGVPLRNRPNMPGSTD